VGVDAVGDDVAAGEGAVGGDAVEDGLCGDDEGIAERGDEALEGPVPGGFVLEGVEGLNELGAWGEEGEGEGGEGVGVDEDGVEDVGLELVEKADEAEGGGGEVGGGGDVEGVDVDVGGGELLGEGEGKLEVGSWKLGGGALGAGRLGFGGGEGFEGDDGDASGQWPVVSGQRGGGGLGVGEAEGEVAEPAGGAAEEEVGDEEGDAFGGGHGGIVAGRAKRIQPPAVGSVTLVELPLLRPAKSVSWSH
jgi:hypothetical protein